MKTAIIAFKDLSNSKYIFNLITLKFDNSVKVVGISDNLKETISLHIKFQPDIVFIDSKSYLNLRQNFFSEYEALYYVDDEIGLMRHIPRNISYLNIYDNFRCLTSDFKSNQKNKASQSLEQKALKQLQDLNFSLKQKGTKYFLEALIYVYENKNKNILNNMKRYIYPGISNKYHTSINKVKWNMEKSISYMYQYNLIFFPDMLNDYLDFEFYQKPTTKELLILLARKL